MSPVKVLFVCAKNQWRSPTAAAIYKNDVRLTVQSAGLSQKSPTRLSAKLLSWADVVMVMEHQHAKRIRDQFRDLSGLTKIVCLEIPDDYEFMNSDLIELLESSIESQLAEILP